MAQLVHDLISNAAWKNPKEMAFRLIDNALASQLDYGQLSDGVQTAGQTFLALGIKRGERVAVLLDKRAEALLAMFGALAAGAAFIALDPMLSAEQATLILRDSGARVLVTTPRRRAALDPFLARCPELRCVLQTGTRGAAVPGLAVFGWDDCQCHGGALSAPRVGEDEAAVILYQRGAGGRPSASVLSHRTLLDYATRLAGRLGARAQQRSLALLPFGDGCGLGLLASTFAAGGEALLVNHVLARDIPLLVAREEVSAMAAQPWLWMQVAALDWHLSRALRCVTSTGGTLPRPTLDALRRRLPLAQIYLMHVRQASGNELLVLHPGARVEPLLAVAI